MYSLLLLLPLDTNSSADFDEIVDKYERRVFNLIYRLVGDYDEAADLTQDTFVAAYRSFEGFRADASPYTWLYRIAVNVCKNRFREKDRHKEVDGLELDADEIGVVGLSADCGLVDPPPTPERALERRELRRLVEEAIQSLPEDYRIVAVLRDLHGLSYREIAEAADLTLEVVKTRLARARGMLRKKLEHHLL